MSVTDPATALARTPKGPLFLAFALGCAVPPMLMSGACKLPDRFWDVLVRVVSRRD